ELLGTGAAARERRLTLFEQHRCGAGWIEREKLPPALPDPLLDEAHVADPMLGECKPDEAGMRTKRLVDERQHWPRMDRWASELGEGDESLITEGDRGM